MECLDLVENRCVLAILITDIDISCLIIFSQLIEESKLKKKSRDKKKYRLDNDKYFDCDSDVHGLPRFRQISPGKVPQVLLRSIKEGVPKS